MSAYLQTHIPQHIHSNKLTTYPKPHSITVYLLSTHLTTSSIRLLTTLSHITEPHIITQPYSHTLSTYHTPKPHPIPSPQPYPPYPHIITLPRHPDLVTLISLSQPQYPQPVTATLSPTSQYFLSHLHPNMVPPSPTQQHCALCQPPSSTCYPPHHKKPHPVTPSYYHPH